MVNSYIDQLRSVTEVSSESLLEIAMRLPDVLKTKREEFDETEWTEIEKTINESIEEVQGFRADEGAVLAHDFTTRIENIQQLSEEVIELDVERLAQVRERIEKAISDLKQNVDENRPPNWMMSFGHRPFSFNPEAPAFVPSGMVRLPEFCMFSF